MSTPNQNPITTIKGIGEARKKWFQRSFGIGTIDELNQLSLDEILQQAKHDKVTLQRTAVESWLAQAELLASPTRLKPPSERLASKRIGRKGPPSPREWESIAQFVIEIQVKTNGSGDVAKEVNVHHVETDQNATWDEIRFGEMADWMRTKIDPVLIPQLERPNKMPALVENASPISASIAEEEKSVTNPLSEAAWVAETIIETAPSISAFQVSQIDVHQSGNLHHEGHRFTVYDREHRQNGAPMITPEAPFDIEVRVSSFNYAGRESLSCEIKCHALNLLNGSKEELGVVLIQLAEGGTATGCIEHVSLPKGAYKLYVLAHTLPMVLPPDLVEIPILHAM
ncbi:MAG: hypothetical protein AAF633_13565 [Chloroflexota bacterium]